MQSAESPVDVDHGLLVHGKEISEYILITIIYSASDILL